MELQKPVKEGVAVIGGTGFVGRHIFGQWSAEKEPQQLRLLLRSSQPDWLNGAGANCRVVRFDDPYSMQSAIEGCDTLINLLRPQGDGSVCRLIERLLPVIARSGVQKVIHASSIDVYGGARSSSITEATPAEPITPYEKEHFAIEQLLLKSAVPSTILRVGVVFGMGGKNLVGLAHEIATARSWKLSMRRALYGRRRMYLVSAEALAEAVVMLASRQQEMSGEIMLLTEDDAENNNFAFVQDRFALAYGREFGRPPALPPAFLRFALSIRGRSATNPYRRYSGARLAGLGFRPKLEFGARLDRYASALAAESPSIHL